MATKQDKKREKKSKDSGKRRHRTSVEARPKR